MRKAFLSIGDNVCETLVAISEREQARGLMFADSPTPIMTFYYEHPKVNRFWMKNTKAKLDIVFCCSGVVTEVCHGEPYDETPIGSKAASDLVVEFPFGTAKSLGIVAGTPVKLII